MTALVPWQHRLGGAIRRHPVASFLVWSFPVGQAIAFQPVLARAWYDVDLPTAPFVVGANLVGLLLPALVITRVVDGRAGVRALWKRAVRVRVPLRWYGLALVVVPMATTATAVALLGPPEGTGWVLASALAAGLLVQLLVVFLTTNWAEEVAWTGFVQTRLQDRHGPVRAAVATGPLFALQHVSLAYGNGWLGGMVVLVFITATAVPFRFLQGWVANRTGSLFVVGLVHAAGNATTDGSGFGGPGLLPRLFPDDAVGPVHLLASAALGLVVLAATRGRLGRPAARDIVRDSRPAGPPAVPVRRTGVVWVDRRAPSCRATEYPTGDGDPVRRRELPPSGTGARGAVGRPDSHPSAGPGTEPADPVRSRRFPAAVGRGLRRPDPTERSPAVPAPRR
jgi:membrane protease YdiL (CAAX protease family)